MQNRKKFTASFRKLFQSEANKQEKELFARWFSQLDISEGKLFRSKSEEDELEKKIGANLHNHFFPPPGGKKALHLHRWLPATAAAVLIIVAVALLFIPVQKTGNELVFSTSSTTTGEQKIITLSDGSKITLSNSSHLKFPQVFADSIREVFLEGEAFFNIIHNNTKPFIVKTGKLNIQVLGTSFNVRHYESDPTIDVVVATGKVGVYAGGGKETWMLTPGKLLAYDPLTGKARQSTVNIPDYTGWQNGELIFNNEPLENICKRLERWYGVTITIKKPSLKSKKIRLKQKGESLHVVLKMLGLVGSFKYEIKDKTVDIWQ